MILTCAIIDDEPFALDLLESYVRKTPFLRLEGRYASAVEALPILTAQSVDLLFLDIQMPDMNGMEFARRLSGRTRIVFTTAFCQYATDGFRVNALDYLLKPIGYADFVESANRALQWFELQAHADSVVQETPDSIFVKVDYKLVQVRLNDILYVEGLKDYLKIYLKGQARPLLSLMSLKSLEGLLPTTQFIRVHRSYIVRKDKIESVDRGRIVVNGACIPIGESYKADFTAYLNGRTL